jgi:hypothetical protein
MKNCPHCKFGYAPLTGDPANCVDIIDIANGIKSARESTECGQCGVRFQWLPQRVNAAYALRCARESATASIARSPA